MNLIFGAPTTHIPTEMVGWICLNRLMTYNDIGVHTRGTPVTDDSSVFSVFSFGLLLLLFILCRNL